MAAIERAKRKAEERGEALGRLAGTTESIREELRKEAENARALKEQQRRKYERSRWRPKWPWNKKKKKESKADSNQDVENSSSSDTDNDNTRNDKARRKKYKKRKQDAVTRDTNTKGEPISASSYDDISRDVALRQERRKQRHQQNHEQQPQQQQQQQQQPLLSEAERGSLTPGEKAGPIPSITIEPAADNISDENTNSPPNSRVSSVSDVGFLDLDSPEQVAIKRAETLETLADLEFVKTPQTKRKRLKLSCCCG